MPSSRTGSPVPIRARSGPEPMAALTLPGHDDRIAGRAVAQSTSLGSNARHPLQWTPQSTRGPSTACARRVRLAGQDTGPSSRRRGFESCTRHRLLSAHPQQPMPVPPPPRRLGSDHRHRARLSTARSSEPTMTEAGGDPPTATASYSPVAIGTTSTGRSVRCRIAPETEPSSAPVTALSPLDPTTINGAFRARASSTTRSGGLPSRISASALQPSWRTSVCARPTTARAYSICSLSFS